MLLYITLSAEWTTSIFVMCDHRLCGRLSEGSALHVVTRVDNWRWSRARNIRIIEFLNVNSVIVHTAVL